MKKKKEHRFRVEGNLIKISIECSLDILLFVLTIGGTRGIAVAVRIGFKKTFDDRLVDSGQ